MTERVESRTRSVAALAVTALLAACSFTPKYERPAAPVAAAYPTTPPGAAAGAMAPADVAWQDFFGDARLKRLIELSLQNNRDLKVAVLNIEQARAAFQIRRADLFPTVNVGGSATRTHTPAALSLTGASSTLNILSATVGVSSYEVDLFGRVRALSDQALAQFFATEENRKATQISLISSVANAYLATVADDELLKLTEDTLKTRQESYRLSKLKFDSGVASELDLRQAETLVQAAQASLAQLRRQRMTDDNALVLLLGQPLPDDLPPAQSLVDQTMLADVPAGLPSDLLARRPDIRSVEQQMIAANANIGAARAAFFPKISLTGSYGYGSRELGELFNAGHTQWSFGPGISVPIFDGGRNKANLASAKVSQEITVAQYEKTIQSAFREVADALAGTATLGDQLGALQAQAASEDKRLKLSELRYRNGAASYLDLLDSQRSLYAVQQSVIQTQLAQLQTKVTLYRTLGGGWQEVEQPASAGAVRARVTK